jgi:hypothetical protein
MSNIANDMADGIPTTYYCTAFCAKYFNIKSRVSSGNKVSDYGLDTVLDTVVIGCILDISFKK